VKKLVLVLAAAALLGAAPAHAKELLGVQLCGPGGCTTERSHALLEGPGGPFGGELVSPAKPGRWFKGNLLAGDRGKVIGKLPFYYVPDANQIVVPGRFGQVTSWTHPDRRMAPVIARLAARVDPYGTPQLTQVTLNGEKATDPQSYLRLWTIGRKATGYPDGLGSQQVIFYSDPASPWSDGNYVVVYAKAHLILRDGQIAALPKDVAAAVAAGRSLDPGRTFPWLPLVLGAGVLAVLAALAVAVARRVRPRVARAGSGGAPVAQA
jgi:hypothetical protein